MINYLIKVMRRCRWSYDLSLLYHWSQISTNRWLADTAERL